MYNRLQKTRAAVPHSTAKLNFVPPIAAETYRLRVGMFSVFGFKLRKNALQSTREGEVTVAESMSSTERVVLRRIAVSAFQHPFDREATAQLKKVAGFDLVVSKFSEYGFERFDYIWNNANNICVGPRQYPKLYAMLQECCTILDVPEPELYVAAGGVNAFTSGVAKPYIVLQTGLLDLMDDDEVMGVIAHELGHIKCEHLLYSTMANYLGIMVQVAGELTFGVGKLVGLPIQAALGNWSRRSELSADRAALLAVQDPRPCISMLMKLAGGCGRLVDQMNVEEFLTQARAYDADAVKTLSNRAYHIMANAFMKGTHPFAIERAKALNEWVDGPEYTQILSGDFERVPNAVVDGLCPNCQHPVGFGHLFCQKCGWRLVH